MPGVVLARRPRGRQTPTRGGPSSAPARPGSAEGTPMQELRLVAVSEDGTYAVLAVPGRGGRFSLPIDDRLRTVARGQFSRLAQYEIEVENPLRPKEIQDRIRAGETAEEIADTAGIPIDRVRRFEGPVLAEREYRAQEAQRSTVRGHTESGPGPRLGEIVAERLAEAGASGRRAGLGLPQARRRQLAGPAPVHAGAAARSWPSGSSTPGAGTSSRPTTWPAGCACPQVDWPAGRLGAPRRADRDGDPDRLPPRRPPRRRAARRRAGPGAGPRRRGAGRPTHAPWSREAREPGWAQETPTGPPRRSPDGRAAPARRARPRRRAAPRRPPTASRAGAGPPSGSGPRRRATSPPPLKPPRAHAAPPPPSTGPPQLTQPAAAAAAPD